MSVPVRGALVVGMLTLQAAGCHSGGPSPSSSPAAMSYDQAAREADANARESLRALPAGAELTALGDPIPLPCSDDDRHPALDPGQRNVRLRR